MRRSKTYLKGLVIRKTATTYKLYSKLKLSLQEHDETDGEKTDGVYREFGYGEWKKEEKVKSRG